MRSPSKIPAVLLALATAACQDNVRPGPSPGELSQVTVTYVCGNDFDLVSRDPDALVVSYQVLGTSESGELTLPAAASGSSSSTRLTTQQEGSLRVAYQGDAASPVANAGSVCPSPNFPEPEATIGAWTQPFPWPVVAVHLHLLPNGRVLSWGRLGTPYVWDPATGEFAGVPSTTMVFCSGHAFLPDGRLLVTGGHLDDLRGLPDANIFDGATQQWTRVQSMGYARWYPTSTTLPDGEILTMAGTDEVGNVVNIPEVWTGSSWRSLPGASRTLAYYPRAFVAPNGLVFYAGELQQTAYLDPSGAGKWIPVAISNYGRRDYGSAVMYLPGKVMILGGSDPPDGAPTRTAEVIDLTSPSPAWRYTEPMAFARRQFNATLLADGEVLVTGGTSSDGFSDPAGAVRAAEMWNPGTEQWALLASGQVTRVYHSTTLLLPDGRVLHAGSGDGRGLPRELNAELYSPPYLFHGARPVIAEAPDAVGYGERFFVATPDAGSVARVTLIRLPSVTHGFDQNQRFVPLTFRKSAGGLSVAAPESSALSPPGHYLLFILNGVGVPSAASVLQLD